MLLAAGSHTAQISEYGRITSVPLVTTTATILRSVVIRPWCLTVRFRRNVPRLASYTSAYRLNVYGSVVMAIMELT